METNTLLQQLILIIIVLPWTIVVWRVSAKIKTKELEGTDQSSESLDFDLSQYIKPRPIPYSFIIKNPTDKTLTARLFGYNQFLLNSNFGSDSGLKITSSNPNLSYIELLQESSQLPSRQTIIHVKSKNEAQVTQIMSYDIKNNNGERFTMPIILQAYYKSDEEGKKKKDEIKEVIVPNINAINGNTHFSMVILPHTEVEIQYHIDKQLDLKAFMNSKYMKEQLQDKSQHKLPIK